MPCQRAVNYVETRYGACLARTYATTPRQQGSAECRHHRLRSEQAITGCLRSTLTARTLGPEWAALAADRMQQRRGRTNSTRNPRALDDGGTEIRRNSNPVGLPRSQDSNLSGEPPAEAVLLHLEVMAGLEVQPEALRSPRYRDKRRAVSP